ncbi:MAG: hypothetical protein A2W31_16005 [Planctomycetes bacterium RBG_16_64_10]|nr:MAG: hypothetical protein A2W31_16005 [Planctomycetes bacterium RBG_16_64_10]
MSDPIHIVTTTEHRSDAERIARVLIQRRLAACVQISGPITSIYRWQGAVETNQEWRCVAKTDRSKYQQSEQAIRELHPYEVPEIVALPIVAGSQAYLDWLQASLK